MKTRYHEGDMPMTSCTLTTTSIRQDGTIHSEISEVTLPSVAERAAMRFLHSCDVSEDVHWAEVEVHVDGERVFGGIMKEETMVCTHGALN